MSQWYYAIDNERLGPVSTDQVGLLISQGRVDANTAVWTEGMEKWMKLASTDLRQFLPNQAGPPPLTNGWAALTPSSLQSLFRFYWICGAVALVSCSVGMVLAEAGLLRGVIGVIGLGVLATIPGTIAQFILLYQFWHLIQDGKARTTPGKAVGFMFIPLFNFYWFFVAFWGLAKDMNAYIRNHGISAGRVNEAAALATCVLFLCSKMPFVAGAMIALGFLSMAEMKNCAVAITEHRAKS